MPLSPFTNTLAGTVLSGGCPPRAEEEGCLAERLALQVGQEQHLQPRFHAALLLQPVGQQGGSRLVEEPANHLV